MKEVKVLTLNEIVEAGSIAELAKPEGIMNLEKKRASLINDGGWQAKKLLAMRDKWGS